MTDFLKYDFGYSWFVGYGHLVPLALSGALAAVIAWRGWPRWLMLLCGVAAVWAVAGFVITQYVFSINMPLTLPTARFLTSGTGRVLDAGAGSGRAAVGVLLARPGTTVTGLDIYRGYYGIDDNTPERLLVNARIAGVADRADARIGDMRDMPFEDGSFEGVISVAAIDHLRDDGIVLAIGEVARVLRPSGEFLLMIVNVDWWARIASPHAVAHHRPQDPNRWRALLERTGFEMMEEGRRPGTYYFLARKRDAGAGPRPGTSLAPPRHGRLAWHRPGTGLAPPRHGLGTAPARAWHHPGTGLAPLSGPKGSPAALSACGDGSLPGRTRPRLATRSRRRSPPRRGEPEGSA